MDRTLTLYDIAVEQLIASEKLCHEATCSVRKKRKILFHNNDRASGALQLIALLSRVRVKSGRVRGPPTSWEVALRKCTMSFVMRVRRRIRSTFFFFSEMDAH